MKALSIRQPYAHLIVAGLKRIENRTWTTRHRGPLLIHAATRWHAHGKDLASVGRRFGARLDDVEFQFGGIIGQVELVDVVTQSDDIGFDGPIGFVLRNARRLPFKPCRGEQTLFDVTL